VKRRSYGSGSIFKNTRGKYTIQVSGGVDPNGKRIRLSRTASSQKEASKILRELEAEATRLAAGEPQEPVEEASSSSMTTSELFEMWFAAKESNWSERTKELYRHQIDAHANKHIGDIPLKELKPLDIQTMVSAIVEAGTTPTANKVRTMVSSALKQATRWELIDRNPVEAVDPVREFRKEQNLWTPEEARTFLEKNEDDRFYAAYYLLFASGIRRGELLGLRRQDITTDGIHIRQTVTLVHDKPHVGPPKTKRSARFVTLPRDSLHELELHIERLDEDIRIVGKAWPKTDLVFPSEVGTPMHSRNFYRAWTQAIKRADVPHMRIHDVRHLHATLLIEHGEDVKVISDRLGHASVAFTLDRYGHLFQEKKQRAAHSLAKLLG